MDLSDKPDLENEISDLSRAPRRARLSAWTVYSLVGYTILSALMLAFIVEDFSTSTRLARNGRELARDGRLAYTVDVHAGGLHSATVDYSFAYDGTIYRGNALLPAKYLNKVRRYEESGNFPVLFLPRDPSINHPYDWRDDESLSFLSYIFMALIVIQWSMLIRSILKDVRPAK